MWCGTGCAGGKEVFGCSKGRKDEVISNKESKATELLCNVPDSSQINMWWDPNKQIRDFDN